MRTVRCAAVGVLLSAVMAVPVQAQITVHTTLASWLAAVTGAGLDTFDDLDPEEGFYTAPLSRTAGAYSYAVDSENGLFPSGIPGAPGVRDTWLSNFFFEDEVVVRDIAPGPVGVAGNFFLSNEAGNLASTGSFRITVNSGASTWTSVIDVAAATSSFLGFTAAGGISSISVRAQDASELNPIFATINDIRIGAIPAATVPEPMSVLMLTTGLVGLAATSRRRARRR
jgi:hypothetical protein